MRNIEIRWSLFHARFNNDLWSIKFTDWDSCFGFNPTDIKLEIYVEVYDSKVPILNFETRCSSSAASRIQ